MNFTELNKKLEKILEKWQANKMDETPAKELEELAMSDEISVEKIEEYASDYKRHKVILDLIEKKFDGIIKSENVHDIYEHFYVYNLAKSNINNLTQAVNSIKQELLKKSQMIRTEIEKIKQMEQREKELGQLEAKKNN